MFKETLTDASEIVSYIIKTSPNDIDEELVFEYFFGCKAILKKIEINNLQIEDTNHHIQLKSKVKKYQKMSIETMPPIVVQEGKILDGNHRFRIAKKKGMKMIIAYDIISL
jgi:hypothetical protein